MPVGSGILACSSVIHPSHSWYGPAKRRMSERSNLADSGLVPRRLLSKANCVMSCIMGAAMPKDDRRSAARQRSGLKRSRSRAEDICLSTSACSWRTRSRVTPHSSLTFAKVAPSITRRRYTIRWRLSKPTKSSLTKLSMVTSNSIGVSQIRQCNLREFVPHYR